jgi:hypothetical protein
MYKISGRDKIFVYLQICDSGMAESEKYVHYCTLPVKLVTWIHIRVRYMNNRSRPSCLEVNDSQSAPPSPPPHQSVSWLTVWNHGVLSLQSQNNHSALIGSEPRRAGQICGYLCKIRMATAGTPIIHRSGYVYVLVINILARYLHVV